MTLPSRRVHGPGVFLFRYEPNAVVRALGQPIASAASGGVSPIVYRFDLRDGVDEALHDDHDRLRLERPFGEPSLDRLLDLRRRSARGRNAPRIAIGLD